MDSQYDPGSQASSALITIDNEGDWADDEIEIESDERELFLYQESVKSNITNSLPYRTQSPTSQMDKSCSSKDQPNSDGVESEANHCFESGRNKFESLILTEPGNIPISSKTVMYQSPNFHRFAGDLGPTSPNSILISLIMIIVILCVTILPVIFPHQTFPDNNSDDYVIRPNSKGLDKHTNEHADKRCKCICRIPLDSSKAAQNSSNRSDGPNAQRSLYVGSSLPKQCNCRNIVRPHLNLSLVNFLDYCAHCECRYQSRNLTTIKRNVIFFMIVLIGLSLYMFVQYLLKYLRITRRSLSPRLRWLVYQLNESD